MSDALKSNIALTVLDLSGNREKKAQKMTFINKLLNLIYIKTTDNKIGNTGATLLSDALKSNSALAKLNLCCEHERSNTQNSIHSINKPLFFILVQFTDNDIEGKGATSLSGALKSNTTLTKLSLGGEYKRNNTEITSFNNTTLKFSSNKQRTRLEKEEQYH